MNRVVRGSSLLIVTAIVAACAAKRDEGQDEGQQAAERQQGPPTQQPAKDESDARRDELAKAAAATEVVIDIQQVKVPPPMAEAPAAALFREEAAPATTTAMMASRVSGLVGNAAPIYQQDTNTERYQHLGDNPVHLVAEQPVSTFSIDVDTGAYANVRRFLNAGQLPPQDAVRVEEMVNYFDYRYVPPASRDVPFSVATE